MSCEGAERIRLQLETCGVLVLLRGWTLEELYLLQRAVERMTKALGGSEAMRCAIGRVTITWTRKGGGGAYPFWPWPPWKRIRLSRWVLDQEPAWRGEVAVIHELAHTWDAQTASLLQRIAGFIGLPGARGRIVREMVEFVGEEPGPTCYGGLGTEGCKWDRNPVEEWAESVAAYVYPEYIEWLKENKEEEKEAGLRSRHWEFVERQIRGLQAPGGSSDWIEPAYPQQRKQAHQKQRSANEGSPQAALTHNDA